LINCGGTEKIIISNKLINLCGAASTKYQERLRLREEEKRKAVTQALESDKLEKRKKEENLRKIDSSIHQLETLIEIAEKTFSEGNDELSNCLKLANLNRKKVECAQAKIEMGFKRKKELVEEIK